jgi:hypothetical protein
MTLKEKFSLILMEFWSNDWESKCEQEADEFAIGFAEWLVSNCYCEDDHWWLIKVSGDVIKSSKELLEIYKKEKGL